LKEDLFLIATRADSSAPNRAAREDQGEEKWKSIFIAFQ